MQAAEVKKEIQELESLRAQMRWWRFGTMLVLLVIVIVCISMINSSVRGLTDPGTTQDEFVQDVSTKLQETTVPKVQTLAAQTVAQLQPKVRTELGKLNDRVPELAEASMQEFELLQKNLPEKGEKVLNDSFGKMLETREPKIRQMFPDVDEAKVSTLVTNLVEEGHERIQLAHDRMFSQHLNSMNNIFEHILKIQGTEVTNPNEEQSNWEMAVLLVDIFADDLKKLQAESIAKPVAAAKPGEKAKPAAASVKPVSAEKKPAVKKEGKDGY